MTSDRSQTPSPLAIETIGLSKHFGDRVAVDAVNLTVARGTVYGLLGHNGAGKTTLVRMSSDSRTARLGTSGRSAGPSQKLEPMPSPGSARWSKSPTFTSISLVARTCASPPTSAAPKRVNEPTGR